MPKKLVRPPNFSLYSPFEPAEETYFYMTNTVISTLGTGEATNLSESDLYEYFPMGYSSLDLLRRVVLFYPSRNIHQRFIEETDEITITYGTERDGDYLIYDNLFTFKRNFSTFDKAEKYLASNYKDDLIYIIVKRISSRGWH
jgi:hypothetical protein